MSLKGKVAVVTGGNSGIGKAIALGLAKRGANIVIDYIVHPEATEEEEKQIIAMGDQAIGVQADVSKVADLQKLIDEAVKAFGRVDIMINNAGVETRTSILDTTEDQYDRVMDINLKSAFFGTQVAAQQMLKQGAEGASSTSLRCTRTGRCRATRLTASLKGVCACSPVPRVWNWLRKIFSSSALARAL